jgi:hypothetical protein
MMFPHAQKPDSKVRLRNHREFPKAGFIPSKEST